MKKEKKQRKPLINMESKRNNIIISSVCFFCALVFLIVSAIQFTSFRNYETQFVLRENVVDEVVKFHQYSKHLKGTKGDSNIYVINGTENTVALVKADKVAEYESSIPASAKLVACMDDADQIAAAKATLARADVTEVLSPAEAVDEVKSGASDVAIMRHYDAKLAVKADSSLAIAKATLENVPSMLVIGGTHPNEPSGQLTATLLLENANVKRGILYVVTELNRSAYSHSLPQEATSWYYSFKLADGSVRKFKYGARASNTVDQWPTPDVYTHSSGQQLSSSEVRNINRAYPGSETGTFTEKIAYAITNFINKNNVTIVIDLHEASPEYKTINAMVYHQGASEVANQAAAFGFGGIYDDGSTISCELSPFGLHGLTHRELGDYTGAYVFLFETSNASQGKIHGKFTPELILYDNYKDKFYEAAAEKEGANLLYARPVSIHERVARHTDSVMSIVDAYNEIGVSRSDFNPQYCKMAEAPVGGVSLGDFVITGIPEYNDIKNGGVQQYFLSTKNK